MKRLLAAADLSERSDRALRRAVSLARQCGCDLLVVHVVDDDQPEAIVKDEVRRASRFLKQRVTALTAEQSVAHQVTVTAGDAFAEIVEQAERFEADLVVMGAHRRRVLGDVLVGTTVERVIRTGRRPVLRAVAKEPSPYRRVVAATDLSDASAEALRAAHALGLLDRAELAVVHAVGPLFRDMMAYAGVEADKIAQESARAGEMAQTRLFGWLGALRLGDAAPAIHVREGRPFDVIAEAVRALGCDLLLIGSRGQGLAGRLLLGSVADEVLRKIECDVLAAPPPAAA